MYRSCTSRLRSRECKCSAAFRFYASFVLIQYRYISFPSEMTAKESGDNNKSELPDAGKGLPAGRPGKDEE